MRPLHWSKVPDMKLQGTIWLEDGMDDKKVSLDVEGFEAVFGLVESRGRSATAERDRSVSVEGKKAKKEVVNLIDTKRSYQISISLARIKLSDEQIKAATLELAKTGLYVEPTCAQAAAAYHELLAKGAIQADEVTVVVLTGTGVKATPRIAEILGVEL